MLYPSTKNMTTVYQKYDDFKESIESTSSIYFSDDTPQKTKINMKVTKVKSFKTKFNNDTFFTNKNNSNVNAKSLKGTFKICNQKPDDFYFQFFAL